MLLFLLYHTLVCMYMDDLPERGCKLDCAFLEIPCRYDCSTGILIVGENVCFICSLGRSYIISDEHDVLNGRFFCFDFLTCMFLRYKGKGGVCVFISR